MSEVVNIKGHIPDEELTHVMFDRERIARTYDCEVCGELVVAAGIVCHTKPIEEHDNE